MAEISGSLAAEFGEMGAKFRAVSLARVKELAEEIRGARRDGRIDERLYGDYLGGFQFEAPEELPGAKSAIVIAVPQGKTVLDFQRQGKRLRTVIPPTYVYSRIRGECTAALSRAFAGTGNRAVKAVLPLKLLAVRSGLAQYGRNNISYVEGMGSFHRLEAFFTDYDFGKDSWWEKSALAKCADCRLCQEACPTGAIRADSFQVDAARCLTYFNESERAMPEWIGARAHNAIVGCMRCQQVCPANRGLLDLTEATEDFSEAETELILGAAPKEKLPEALAAKLARLNMEGYYGLLARNLSLLPWK